MGCWHMDGPGSSPTQAANAIRERERQVFRGVEPGTDCQNAIFNRPRMHGSGRSKGCHQDYSAKSEFD